MTRLGDETTMVSKLQIVSTSTTSLAHDIAVGRVGKAMGAYAIREPMAQ